MQLHAEIASPVTPHEITTNVAAALALDLPPLPNHAPAADRGRLAIVGGGPSIERRVNALRTFGGAVWAINGAALWADTKQIRAQLFSVDPTEKLSRRLTGCRAKTALLALQCHATTYRAVQAAKVTTFDASVSGLAPLARRIMARWPQISWPPTLTSSVSIAALVGLACGYQELVFFGCEGCYSKSSSHAYLNERTELLDEIIVLCGGQKFLTRPDYLQQSFELAHLLRSSPALFRERSGGLTRALTIEPRYDIVGASPEVLKVMKIEAAHAEGVVHLMSKEYADLING